MRSALCRNRECTRRTANCHRIKAPRYVCGQKVWLSTRDLPLQCESRKLALRFICPFSIIKVLSPAAVKLKLPPNLQRVHPVFHVSCLRPVVRTTARPTHCPVLVEGSPVYRLRKLLDVRHRPPSFSLSSLADVFQLFVISAGVPALASALVLC